MRTVNKYMDPKAVPRIVCGLRNLQKESLRSDRVFDKGVCPAASAWENVCVRDQVRSIWQYYTTRRT